MKLVNIPQQFDTKFSSNAYTYNAMNHLNGRMLNLYLLYYCNKLITVYATVIIWGNGEGGRQRRKKKQSVYLQDCIMENNNEQQ